MLDPQLHRYLKRIADAGGEIWVSESEEDELTQAPGYERALAGKFIRHIHDGAGWRVCVALTNQGRDALGLPREPQWFFALCERIGLSV